MMRLMQIVLASTTIFLAAGRFGLTPSANRLSTPGLKLVENSSGLQTGDPAGKWNSRRTHSGTQNELRDRPTGIDPHHGAMRRFHSNRCPVPGDYWTCCGDW